MGLAAIPLSWWKKKKKVDIKTWNKWGVYDIHKKKTVLGFQFKWEMDILRSTAKAQKDYLGTMAPLL